ncbi:RNA-directed DNA polymerase from mobile element jockey [Trichonephila clavipes]|nr:RNA-directed DNA polymerase from mobile element jockey [Trichonephila clavipes]
MGDFNAKHSSWGCDVDTRRGITFNHHIQRSGYRILAPPTPTRYGHDSASTLDLAISTNVDWPCTATSISELSSDHNPVTFEFTTTFSFSTLVLPRLILHVVVSGLVAFFVLHLDYNGYVRFQDRCGFISRVRGFVRSLDEILFTLEDVDAEAQITPERLSLTRFAAEAATSETPARIAAERRSVEEAGEIGAKASSHIRLLAISKTRLLWRKGESSAEESSVEIASAKSATPVIAQSSPAAKAAESASAPGPSKKDDGFTTVGRNGKRIAPIVIDAQSNATELLTQIGNLCSNSSLQGRFENGKLRVFPTSAEEHRIIQNGPHPANFSGCPKTQSTPKQQNQKRRKTSGKEPRAAARKQTTNNSKPSFAEVVKGSSNNSLDAKEVMTKMAQMMSQWGEMLSLLQSKL